MNYCKGVNHVFICFLIAVREFLGQEGDKKNLSLTMVLPIAAPYFPLVHNYRTTREIAHLCPFV